MKSRSLSFFVPGPPKALKRHRTCRVGSGFRQYDASASDKSRFLALALPYRPGSPLREALHVTLVFHYPHLKSHYNSKGELKASAPRRKTTKPDPDNLIKLVLDALNGVFWSDDAIIWSVWGRKVYSENPGVEVRIVPAKDGV